MTGNLKSNNDSHVDSSIQTVKEEGKKTRGLIRIGILILCATSLIAPHISGILIYIIAGFLLVFALAEFLTLATRG